MSFSWPDPISFIAVVTEHAPTPQKILASKKGFSLQPVIQPAILFASCIIKHLAGLTSANISCKCLKTLKYIL